MASIDLHTPDRLVYQIYPVTSNRLTFKIKAPKDAHIILLPASYDCQPCYEIFFGGWENTKSVIRKNKQNPPDVVEVATPQILNAQQYRGFWIRWDSGYITAGVQGDENPLLKHYDPYMFHIQYFGVCTGWGASGHWIIDNSPAAPAPYGYQPSYPQPAATVYPQLSQPPYNPGFGYGAPRWVQCGRGSVPPPNAVVGGHDINGETIYVARAHHEGALLPGKFAQSHGGAFVAWGGRENSKFGYEVLCDGNPRWVQASGNRVPPGAFVGGKSEGGETLYIGRAHHNGSLTPGKVQPSHGVCYIPFGGEEIAKSNYEVLMM